MFLLFVCFIKAVIPGLLNTAEERGQPGNEHRICRGRGTSSGCRTKGAGFGSAQSLSSDLLFSNSPSKWAQPGSSAPHHLGVLQARQGYLSWNGAQEAGRRCGCAASPGSCPAAVMETKEQDLHWPCPETAQSWAFLSEKPKECF